MEIPKEVAVILFYNSKGEILLQNRKENSKWGEEYGFFGGKVEKGETHEQAIRRELIEELELDDIDLTFFKRYTHKEDTGHIVDRSVYLSIMPDLKNIVCHEGKPEVRRFENSMNLKLIPGFEILLKEIYEYLKSKNIID